MSSPEPDAVPLAIVVGAGGSFGTEIVAALVEAGQRVIGVGRDTSAMAHLAERHGAAFRAVAADIASDEAVATIGAAITGPVAMVVHAPGVPVAGGIKAAPTAALVEAAATVSPRGKQNSFAAFGRAHYLPTPPLPAPSSS